jgi:hypothetical protein
MGGSQGQNYLPFQYGVPQFATISMSAFAYGVPSGGAGASARFTGFEIFDRPGVRATGATAVVDFNGVPEPGSAWLLLIGSMLLLVRKIFA